jgi:hypothetical protein
MPRSIPAISGDPRRSIPDELDGYRQLLWEDRSSSSDANSRLTVGFASGAAGAITATIGGGQADTYPLNGAVVYWRAVDMDGRPLDPTLEWAIELILIEVTAPGTSSDTAVEMGLINEATTSATVDGQFEGLHYTGAARNVRTSGIVNGANNGLADDGATAGTLRQVRTWVVRHGTTRTAYNGAQGMDNAGAAIANDYVNGSSTGGGAAYLASGTPTIFLAIHRTATTAGSHAVSYRVYARATRQSGALT